MGYAKLGTRQRPLGSYLPQLCKGLMSHGGSAGWPARISAALTGPGNLPLQKPLSSFDMRELFLTQGSKDYPQGSPQMNNLQHLVLMVLHEMGVIKLRPYAIEYRTSTELTLDEVLDQIVSLEIRFPTLSELGSTEKGPVWAQFVSILITVIKRIAFVDNDRGVLVDRLRIKAADVGWKISRGREVSQAEKTLFLMLAPGAKRARTVLNGFEAPPELVVAESADPLVARAFDAYQSAVEVGPASRFATLIYTGVGNARTYFWGPAPKDLPYSVGHYETKGSFVRYDLEPIANINWSKESQLAAIAEREGSVLGRRDRDFLTIPPPVVAAGATAAMSFSSLDEPEFLLSYVPEAGRSTALPLAAFDVDYTSQLAGRTLSTSVGTFPGPEMLLYDKIFSGQSYGGGEISDLDITDFVLIDPDLSVGFKPKGQDELAASQGPAVIRGGLVSEHIYFTKPGEPDIYGSEVDMSSYYFRKGTFLVLPGLREYVIAPINWALADDEAAFLHIVNRLSLTEEQRRHAKETIMVSHNMAKMAVLLPAPSLPRISPLMVAANRLAHFA